MNSEQVEKMLTEIKKSQALPRKHANFFNWHDKQTKELEIATYLARHLTDQEGIVITTLKASDSDPPDCLLLTEDSTIAVEIVELVDDAAIEMQIKQKLLYPEQEAWTTERLMSNLNKIIGKKDNPHSKNHLIQKYPRYILLIHTDEPELSFIEFGNLFQREKLLNTVLISEVYVLFSYHPDMGTCPVRQLF